MGDVFRFGLEEEEKVSVFLGLVIVGEISFLKIKRIFEVAGDLILLQTVSMGHIYLGARRTYFF